MIFPRLCVLVASVGDEGWRYSLFHVIKYKGAVRIKRKVNDFPLVGMKGKKQTDPFALVLAGKSVVSKYYPPGNDAAERITSRPDEFVFATELCEGGGQRVTFMRASQYGDLLEELAPYKINIIDTRFAADNDVAGEAVQAGREFFGKGLSAGKLFTPTEYSSRLLSLSFSKLLLPVLGAALLVLVVNYFAQSSLRQKYAEQTMLLAGIRRNTAGDSKRRTEKDRFYSMMLPEAALPYSYMADRIASVVPTGVMLSEISVHPMDKKISENKPLTVSAGNVSLRGESSESAPVSVFTESLSSLDITGWVRLRRLERSRDGVYVFEIEVGL